MSTFLVPGSVTDPHTGALLAWVTLDGRRIEPQNLGSEHLLNIIRMLERKGYTPTVPYPNEPIHDVYEVRTDWPDDCVQALYVLEQIARSNAALYHLKAEWQRRIDVAIGEAQQLVGTWYQTSHKHRMVAQLPQDMSGIEALAEASNRPEWAQQLGEQNAGEHYMRVYAPDEHKRTLSPEVWAAYKRLGGGTYR